MPTRPGGPPRSMLPMMPPFEGRFYFRSTLNNGWVEHTLYLGRLRKRTEASIYVVDDVKKVCTNHWLNLNVIFDTLKLIK